jgi:hypothetical protein
MNLGNPSMFQLFFWHFGFCCMVEVTKLNDLNTKSCYVWVWEVGMYVQENPPTHNHPGQQQYKIEMIKCMIAYLGWRSGLIHSLFSLCRPSSVEHLKKWKIRYTQAYSNIFLSGFTHPPTHLSSPFRIYCNYLFLSHLCSSTLLFLIMC